MPSGWVAPPLAAPCLYMMSEGAVMLHEAVAALTLLSLWHSLQEPPSRPPHHFLAKRRRVARTSMRQVLWRGRPQVVLDLVQAQRGKQMSFNRMKSLR